MLKPDTDCLHLPASKFDFNKIIIRQKVVILLRKTIFSQKCMASSRQLSIVADEAIPYLRGFAEPWFDVTYMKGSEILRPSLTLADALIVRTRTLCNRSLLEGTPISYIASATIGYDHIDTEYCTQNGIGWSNAPGCNSGSVMQYMVAAILHLCIEFGLEPGQLTLGIVGAGHVGSKVAAAASKLGMKVLINDPPRQKREGARLFTPLPQLLKEADLVTLHVPLTLKGSNSTFHLAGREFISSMKRGSFLFNTSRGGVTCEEEVKRALWSGQLKGYIADVWAREPIADSELIEMAAIATPHIAGYSADGKLNGTRMALQGVAERFRRPITLPLPDLLPIPENSTINPQANHSSLKELLSCFVKQTYNIEEESRLFKSTPSQFEAFRNNYPLRREFNAFTLDSDFAADKLTWSTDHRSAVKTADIHSRAIYVAGELGFKIGNR
jgi:erythronate-4-phosphate dehydrogenase